ncbi:hypothetical protein ACXIVK_27885 [Paraburkholderia caledonica]
MDQMTEARALCGKDPVLAAKLDNLLNKRPNDRIMQKFIDYLRDPNRHEGRFAIGSHATLRVTGFRVQRNRSDAKQRDSFTPIFFASVVTVLFEAVVVVLCHADPDMHFINYVLTGMVVFGAVAAATDADVNG